jgi:Lon protease-like protein
MARSVSHIPGELSIFPLNVVLFPGMPLPLHVFEERYKSMIRGCIDGGNPFGVVLIKEGSEVGGYADPFTVGTTARIVKVEYLDGGRMRIMTQGMRRFSILQIIHREPYIKALVLYLTEKIGHPVEEHVNHAQDLFINYMRTLAGLSGGWVNQIGALDDIQAFTYMVAHFMNLPARVRQSLLEVSSAEHRLIQEIPLLQSQSEQARRELIKRSPFQGLRLN